MLHEDGEGLIGIDWSPSCGNDIVQAFHLASVPISSQIPEPGTSLVQHTCVRIYGDDHIFLLQAGDADQ